MFFYKTNFQNNLHPNAYWQDSLFHKEQDALKYRSWHWACLKSDLALDFRHYYRIVSGCSIFIWNQSGVIRAFTLNLENDLDSFKLLLAQYHLIYDISEIQPRIVCEIPVETIGNSVMISLNLKSNSLRTTLGSITNELDDYFSNRNLFYSSTIDVAVNWKLVVENFIETYHIPFVHGYIFKNYSSETLSDHKIESTYTRYFDLRPWSSEYAGYIYMLFAFILCNKSNPKRFVVTHIFPNYIFYYADLFSVFFYIEPLQATKTRVHSYFYSPSQLSWPLLSKPLRFLMQIELKSAFLRILKEDYVLLKEVQAGICHATSNGVLSRREERIFAFQSYIKES